MDRTTGGYNQPMNYIDKHICQEKRLHSTVGGMERQTKRQIGAISKPVL